MRVAVIGQGSIGRRHAQILTELGQEVVVFDPDRGREPSPDTTRAADLESALEGADAAVIASPSDQHPAQARQALESFVPVLVEKPLALGLAAAIALEQLARERGVLLAVAMNLRHHPGVLALRELLAERAIGGVLSARAWCGSWLPGWRAHSDYRASYSARSELGGGVLLDVAVHELDYLLWLLGPARAVTALARRVSSLELDVEDVALVALELVGGPVAHVAVDYFDRAYHRGCRLVGEAGSAHWSWEDGCLIVTDAEGSREERSIASDVAPTYRQQLECFLTAVVRGDGEGVVAAADARRVLAVIEAARASSRAGRRVTVSEPIRLRPAGLADSVHILAWRNDPDTRTWSRTTDQVPVEEHERWLAKQLADPATSLWIGESESVPVGQIRATRQTPNTVELHVTVAPGARGRGFGAGLIMEATALALADPEVEMVIAHVNPGNIASLRAFERGGFQPAGLDAVGFQRLERSRCR